MDNSFYYEISCGKKIFPLLVDTSGKRFKTVQSRGYISDKEMKYFTYNYKKEYVIQAICTCYMTSMKDFLMCPTKYFCLNISFSRSNLFRQPVCDYDFDIKSIRVLVPKIMFGVTVKSLFLIL